MTSTATFKASGAAGPLIYIPSVYPGEKAVIAAEAGHDLYFGFFPAVVTSARAGDDLVFVVEGGGTVVVQGFFAVYRESFPTLLLPDGTAVAAEDFFEGSTFDLHTAAGPVFSGAAESHGTWTYRDDAGSLLSGVSRLGYAGSGDNGGSRFADGNRDASLGAVSGVVPGVVPGAVPIAVAGAVAGAAGGWESSEAAAGVSSRPDTPGADDDASPTPGGPSAGPGGAEAGEGSGGDEGDPDNTGGAEAGSGTGEEGDSGNAGGAEAGSGTEPGREDGTGEEGHSGNAGGAEAGSGTEPGRGDGTGEEDDSGDAGGAEAGSGTGQEAGGENDAGGGGNTDAGDADTVSGGFDSVPDGSTGVVPIADGRLTVQAITIRIMGGVAEVASTDARLSVDENGLLGVASEQSCGDATTLDAWEGLVITCGDGGVTSRMDIGYTVATWDGSVYYQLYDADGNLMGWPVQVDLLHHTPGTEGTLSITPPAGYEDFAGVMLYANGACKIAFSAIETTVTAGESAEHVTAGADAGLHGAAAGPDGMADGAESLDFSGEAGGGGAAEAAGADFFGWDEAIPFYTGAMDCMMDPVMLDASGLPPYDPLGLSGHAPNFSIEGFPDLENDVLTLVTSRDGEVVTQKIEIHFVDDMLPGTGSAIQPFMAAGPGHAEMEGDCGLQEQALSEMLIKTTTC